MALCFREAGPISWLGEWSLICLSQWWVPLWLYDFWHRYVMQLWLLRPEQNWVGNFWERFPCSWKKCTWRDGLIFSSACYWIWIRSLFHSETWGLDEDTTWGWQSEDIGGSLKTLLSYWTNQVWNWPFLLVSYYVTNLSYCICCFELDFLIFS